MTLPTDQANEPSGADPGAAVPATREARTWELELLISGAVLYALLRAPVQMDRWFNSLHPHVTAATGLNIFMVYYFAKVVVYILIASFVVHLMARAYWVGLVGLHTVYPHGVRWDDLKFGPVSKTVYQERQPSLPAQILRADQFCSTIFPLAFSIALTFLLGTFAFLALTMLMVGVQRLLDVELPVRSVLYGIIGLLVVPPMIAGLLDRFAGEHIRKWPLVAGALRGVIRGSYTVMGAWAYAPVMNVLMSNARKTQVYAVYFVLIPLTIGFFLVHDILVPRGLAAFESYPFVPAVAGEHGLGPQHYENLRSTEGPVEFVPSIQSDVVTGPFVRLFVPYNTDRHSAEIAARCPDVAPFNEGELRFGRPDTSAAAHRAAALACLSSIQRVFVNGEERSDLRFHYYRDPETTLRGVVTYIPTATLPSGENLLTVDPPPRIARDDERGRPPAPQFQIPFWVGHAEAVSAAPAAGR